LNRLAARTQRKSDDTSKHEASTEPELQYLLQKTKLHPKLVFLRNVNLRSHWRGGAPGNALITNQRGSEPGNAIIAGDSP
jgi:hypothetical protein